MSPWRAHAQKSGVRRLYLPSFGGVAQAALGWGETAGFRSPSSLQLTLNKLPNPTLLVLVSKSGIRLPSS